MKVHPASATRFLIIMVILCPGSLWSQAYRMSYQFPSGRLYSSGVQLPVCHALELGEQFRPWGITDKGVVLLSGPENTWYRWRNGILETLHGVPDEVVQARMNETGYVVMTGYGGSGIAEVSAWAPDSSIAYPVLRNFLPHDHYQLLYDMHLNDHGDFTLTAMCDTSFYASPYAYYSVTAYCPYPTGWMPLAETHGYHARNGASGTDGTTYSIDGLNNYGTTVGVFGEFSESTPPGGWPTTIHTSYRQYTVNGNEILGFEPLGLTDTMTIVGREIDYPHALVIRDRFGERFLQTDTTAYLPGRPLISNPDGPFEEIIVEDRYWKRMQERDFSGLLTGSPSPDFHEGNLSELLSNRDCWSDLDPTCISNNGRMAGRATYTDPDTGLSRSTAFVMLPPLLVPDWNRDGIIDRGDKLLTVPERKWRFWINDDDDDGPVSRSSEDDLPADTRPHGSPVDAYDLTVDGARDCVDFFPVHLDLQDTLQAIGDLSEVSVRLSHPDGAINLLYSNLKPDEVHHFHNSNPQSGFGRYLGSPAAEADLVRITHDGIVVPQDILTGIRDDNQGVVFLEAVGTSTEPLQLTLSYSGQVVMGTSLPVSLSPVRDMIRIINLSQADPKFCDPEPGPWSTHTSDPTNLPDAFLEELSGALRTLVHIHGFNWATDEVPAAHAEIFKRLFQTGSMARFIGITWHGSQGKVNWADMSFDYNENVINAFVVSGYAADALSEFLGPQTALFSHSLGTLVAVSAIVDHGIETGHCLLLNSAIPTESFIGEQADRRLMVHPHWKDEPGPLPDYPEFLLAPNWSRLFQSDDRRSALSWKDRFQSLGTLTECTHFFSSAEDVLRPGDGSIPNLLGEVIAGDEGVWVFNEMVKGTTSLSATLTGDIHGGWGMNREYMSYFDLNGPARPPPGDWIPMSPVRASDISTADLITEPFFRPFSGSDADFPTWGDGSWLYADTATANIHLPESNFRNATINQIKNHAKVLAEAIPAHSAAAGTVSLPNLPLLRNFDMDTQFRSPTNWPLRTDVEDRDRWLHGDYLKVALTYVHAVYATCSKIINLL